MDGEWMRAVSPARCTSYLKACGGDPARALELYEWNLEVAGAFGHPLHYLEVVTRNAIHDVLKAHFGRDDWWNVVWNALQEQACKAIRTAEADRRRKYGCATPDGIVSSLALGFWVGLTSKRHNYEMTFWRPCLHQAFPGYQGKQGQLFDALDTVRLLRNRIAHHEPIFRRHLAKDFDKICSLIGFVSADMEKIVRAHPGVRNALARRPGTARGPRS